MRIQGTGTDGEAHAEQELAAKIQALEDYLRRRLSREAFLRYGNIKAANPDMALSVLVTVTGYLERNDVSMLSDGDFKAMLKKMIPKKRDISITRK